MIAASRHRPFHPASEPHQQFLQQQLGIIAQLEQEFPFLNMNREREALMRRVQLIIGNKLPTFGKNMPKLLSVRSANPDVLLRPSGAVD